MQDHDPAGNPSRRATLSLSFPLFPTMEDKLHPYVLIEDAHWARPWPAMLASSCPNWVAKENQRDLPEELPAAAVCLTSMILMRSRPGAPGQPRKPYAKKVTKSVPVCCVEITCSCRWAKLLRQSRLSQSQPRHLNRRQKQSRTYQRGRHKQVHHRARQCLKILSHARDQVQNSGNP